MDLVVAGGNIIEGGIPDSKTHFSKNAHLRKIEKFIEENEDITPFCVTSVYSCSYTEKKENGQSPSVAELANRYRTVKTRQYLQ